MVKEVHMIGPGFMQQVQRPCGSCKGKGMDKNYEQCKSCEGKRLVLEEYKISTDIEKGVKEGDIIVAKNAGHEIFPEDRDKYERGDIYIIIHEKKHKIFRRGSEVSGRINPYDLNLELEITLEESLCGFERTIKHLDGKELLISEMDIIKHKEKRYIPGEGMPHKNSGKRGDLFVKYIVKYPTNISYEQKKGIYKVLTGNSLDDVKTISDEDKKIVNTQSLDS